MRHYYNQLFLKWNPPIKWSIPPRPRKQYDFTIIDQVIEWHGDI